MKTRQTGQIRPAGQKQTRDEPLNSQRLLAFYTVAQEQSFTRAGSQMGLTQSAISHSIRGLERELGVRLFDRLGRSIRLTKAGHVLLPHATAILAEMQHTREHLVQQEPGQPNPPPCRQPMPDITSFLCRTCPAYA
ncbi:MAG: LysR family transcriptional regulator [Opitutaceae bacterium]|jgi:DNA-binding transcriptional ArsR family regulator|nr:LysR family transcriptional regulator [Opitutaceae bacterium]